MNHLSNWEKGLQSRLAHHEVTPPPTGWADLQKALEAKQSVPLHTTDAPAKKSHKHLFTLWLTTATATAAACLVVALLTHSNTPSAETNALAQQQTASNTIQQPSPTTGAHHSSASQEATDTQPNHPLLAQIGQEVQRVEQKQSSVRDAKQFATLSTPSETNASTTDTTATSQSALAETPTAESSAPHLAEEKNENTSPSLAKHQVEKAERIADYIALVKQKVETKQSVSFNLMANTQLGGSSAQLGYLPLTSSAAPKQETANNNAASVEEESAALPTVMGANLNQYVQSKVRHKMPVQLGLTLNIPLRNRWSLTTGFTYTLLNSESQSGTTASYYVTNQSLHYVGIPLQVNYALLSTRPVNLYVGAGVALEKCVKGVQSTEFVVSGSYHATTPEVNNLGKGLWQGSAGATAGIQINITPQFGIYVEPGLRYYIPDGSSLPNIRHDKPFNFSLQTGLRVSL